MSHFADVNHPLIVSTSLPCEITSFLGIIAVSPLPFFNSGQTIRLHARPVGGDINASPWVGLPLPSIPASDERMGTP